MPWVFLCVAALASPGGEDNLLSNSGFEELDLEGLPTPWAVFVLPKEGARGDLDDAAGTGRYSVMLHNPEPYEEEPANNWSQVIVADFGGKELVLRGHIRTDAATEAALWLQCFSKNPARVLAAKTSSYAMPVYGTNDWTAVEIEMIPPEGTDFVVVRCVLKGRGTAWFDDVELVSPGETFESLALMEPSDGGEKLSKREVARDILEVSESLRESIGELEASNAALQERLRTIQAEMAAYRDRLSDASAYPLEPELEAILGIRHPLVPHGYEEGEQTP